MTFMYNKQAAESVIPAVSAENRRLALRIGCALALMAATIWVAGEAAVDQSEQQMIHEIQANDRP